MGYNIEISVNLLKETKFTEMEEMIEETAKFYNCESVYSFSEEDGTQKIPRYSCVYVIHFFEDNFDNFIEFIRIMKNNCRGYIECVYNNHMFKLIYASSYYLKNIDKDVSQKYKNYIKDRKFSFDETAVLQTLNKISC